MKKNSSDIVILVIGAIVLVVGVLAYIFMESNSFGDKSGISKDVDVYKFLVDTDDVYCRLIELADYNREIAVSGGGKQKGWEEYRNSSQKTLARDYILGLDDTIKNYSNDYSNYPFNQTIRSIQSSYKFFIEALNSMSSLDTSGLSNRSTCIENYDNNMSLSIDAKDYIEESLIEEYKAIRGEDETSWPKKEIELLDLNSICPRKNFHTDGETRMEDLLIEVAISNKL